MQTNVVSGVLVNVQLTDRLGSVLPLYWHNGRYYVEASDMQEYRLRVRSLVSGRLEVLTAVDGLNTLLTEEANVYTNSGMVISDHSLYEVKGWRINDQQTRPFVFTSLDEEAVAKQMTNSSSNLGVIAIAVYREYEIPLTYNNLRSGPQAKSLGFESLTRGAGMGTGMGNRVDRDVVGHTTFRRATSSPDQVVQIFAMPKWWLEREGVLTADLRDRNHPNGFPGSDTGYNRFKKIG